MNRTQKLQALQSAILGNVEPLRQFTSQRGRPYTAQELEERQRYLSELLGRPASQEETIRMLGRYDKSNVPGKVCIEFTTTIRAWLN